tara:strand:- start:53 stop:709 length:657 start_codon:yes stop_codon:yes gene_type:complete
MEHYKKEYFEWQKNHGEFGGISNLFKFRSYINKDDNVIDFGSGGGYLLYNIECKNKIGIEINDVARDFSIKNGVHSVKSPNEIDDDWADIIISNHALEHTENPLFELKRLHNKLKKNGKIVFVVPHEKRKKYNPDNIHQHFFTWAEINLGNLFNHAGYRVLKVEDLKYTNLPKFRTMRKLLGPNLFFISGKVYHFFRSMFSFLYKSDISQIRIVAEKN